MKITDKYLYAISELGEFAFKVARLPDIDGETILSINELFREQGEKILADKDKGI